MDPKIARWHRKADALAAAWERRNGALPAKHTVLLALCPPSAETRCGDSWPGPDGELGTQDDENNWGATTARSLNAEELAAVKAAGIVATVGPGHVVAAKAAQAALESAGLGFVPMTTKRGILIPRGTIHCDSRTEKRGDGRSVQVPYFVWFAAFDTDDQGAEYYLTFVAEPGFPSRAVLENPKATVHNLAAAMYARSYFWGFKPHGIYTHPGADKVLGTADDELRDGNAENVTAYGRWLEPHFATISAALKDWQPRPAAAGPGELAEAGEPTATPQPDPIDLSRAADVQRALNLVGCGRPPLKVDGDFARKSIAALGFYEGGSSRVEGEPWTDVTGAFPLAPATRTSLERDLIAMGYTVR